MVKCMNCQTLLWTTLVLEICCYYQTRPFKAKNREYTAKEDAVAFNIGLQWLNKLIQEALNRILPMQLQYLQHRGSYNGHDPALESLDQCIWTTEEWFCFPWALQILKQKCYQTEQHYIVNVGYRTPQLRERHDGARLVLCCRVRLSYFS